MRLWLRSLVYTIVLWLSVLIYAPLSVMTFPFPYRWRYRFIVQWSYFQVWALKVICGIRYRIEGAENIPAGPAIVMAKHQSSWETFALFRVFPRQAYVLKRELLRIPFFGWGLAMMAPIAIDRGSGRRAIEQLIEQGRQRLQAGTWVVVFPEGSRMPPGTRGRYKLGGAVLAAETGYPVVPVAHNAGQFWPRNTFIKRPGTIRVVVGPVIDSKGRTADSIVREVEDWIETAMQELEGRDSPAPLVQREFRNRRR